MDQFVKREVCKTRPPLGPSRVPRFSAFPLIPRRAHARLFDQSSEVNRVVVQIARGYEPGRSLIRGMNNIQRSLAARGRTIRRRARPERVDHRIGVCHLDLGHQRAEKLGCEGELVCSGPGPTREVGQNIHESNITFVG